MKGIMLNQTTTLATYKSRTNLFTFLSSQTGTYTENLMGHKIFTNGPPVFHEY